MQRVQFIIYARSERMPSLSQNISESDQNDNLFRLFDLEVLNLQLNLISPGPAQWYTLTY